MDAAIPFTEKCSLEKSMQSGRKGKRRKDLIKVEGIGDDRFKLSALRCVAWLFFFDPWFDFKGIHSCIVDFSGEMLASTGAGRME